MTLETGQIVWVSWSHCTHADETAIVDRCVVVAAGEDGDVAVRTDRGTVRMINPWGGQRVHDSEAEAWQACAAWLRQRAAAIGALADECAAKAGEGVAA